jgi:hypothetical protein
MKTKLLFLFITFSSIVLMDSFGVNAQTIAAGYEHGLVVCSDSTARAWGDNRYGELGNGTNTSGNIPLQVSSLTGIIAIAGGAQFSLALKNDGTVWAWGYNYFGELGNGTNTSSNFPVQVTGLCPVLNEVNEITEQLSVTVSPNPFSSSTTLQIDKLFKDATLTVYNSLGQQVKQLKNISGQTITLSRDNLPGGLYFIRLTEENKILSANKLIITDN